ncbi:BA75_00781T0 [Komagataella pastoris]|uniref:BA75_00781T0 n=1 Tax=Komagataella pastoris TaxID=4922 RepID=A0A1B2J8X8_PICPA|nr:BA75_00781T0 [Komagataella pastoris]
MNICDVIFYSDQIDIQELQLKYQNVVIKEDRGFFKISAPGFIDDVYYSLIQDFGIDESTIDIIYHSISHPGNIYFKVSEVTDVNPDPNSQLEGDSPSESKKDLPPTEIPKEVYHILFTQFEKYGIIIQSKIVTDYGFVKYKTKTSADQILMHLKGFSTKVNDRVYKVYVNHHISKKARLYTRSNFPPPDLPIPGPEFQDCNLYVKNLPPSTTDERLKQIFSQFGKIKSFKVITHEDTGACKGYGFVCFVNPLDASKAMVQLNNAFISPENFTIAVSFAKRNENKYNSKDGKVHHYNQNHYFSTATGSSMPPLTAQTTQTTLAPDGMMDPSLVGMYYYPYY